MSIDERISEALRRLVAGMGAMRIPADPCDADLVLSDAKTELATLRAQLEAVTRERDGYREALEVANAAAKENAEERDEAREALHTRAAAHAHYRTLWLRAFDVKSEQMQNVARQRDEALADAARMRAALGQVRDAMLATGQGPDGDDDPRRPLATTVWAALSAPTPEPSERMMRVAEAVLAHFTTAFAAVFGEQAAKDIRSTIDLRAIVAKVTP